MKALIAVTLLMISMPAMAAEHYGVASVASHHFSGSGWNESNPGIGWERHSPVENMTGVWSAGIVRDSWGDMAPYVGAGIMFGRGRIRFGASFVAIHRKQAPTGFLPVPMIELGITERLRSNIVLMPNPNGGDRESSAVLLQFKYRLR